MRATELACAAIVLLYAFVRLRAPGASRGAIAARLLVLVCAAWVGEDSVIRAYGFYGYAPEWSLFVDRVPLLIVAIWPVVIDSAHVLARSLVADASRASRVALAGGLIVLADASLIEPIAVHAHLWSWSAANARAVFEVPAIGILGWGYFAAAAIATLELAERQKAPESDERSHDRGGTAGDARGADHVVVGCLPLGGRRARPVAARGDRLVRRPAHRARGLGERAGPPSRGPLARSRRGVLLRAPRSDGARAPGPRSLRARVRAPLRGARRPRELEPARLSEPLEVNVVAREDDDLMLA